jgi:hypothetical protein
MLARASGRTLSAEPIMRRSSSPVSYEWHRHRGGYNSPKPLPCALR